MKFAEDNNGFVFFPLDGPKITVLPDNKTIIYIVAFEPTSNKSSLSSINITMPGDFISDDVVERMILNDVVKSDVMKNEYDSIYFPNVLNENIKERIVSISMVAAISIGWSDNAYEFKNGTPWRATFRDLTEEGKKLYYSMKKLHNNKEIRILTFNNI
jgi:hypothetical protein